MLQNYTPMKLLEVLHYQHHIFIVKETPKYLKECPTTETVQGLQHKIKETLICMKMSPKSTQDFFSHSKLIDAMSLSP